MPEIMFPLENTDYMAEDVQTLFATRTSGIYGNEHLTVTPAGGLKTSMAPGLAWLAFSRLGGAVYANRDDLVLTHDTADAVYDRIDRIVIRADIAANGGYAAVIKGTPSANPQPPSITRDATAYEIARASVHVRAGAQEITSADITDESMDEAVCGVMSDGMRHISTGMLYAQVQEMISQLKSGIQTVYDGVQLVNVTEFEGVLSASGWTGNGPYMQRVTASGVLGADKPFADLDLTNITTAEQLESLNGAWGDVLKATAENGAVAFYFANIPDVDIPVKLKVVR